MAWKPNPGELPSDVTVMDDDWNVVGFKSVHVRLHSGYDSKAAGHAPWPAKGGRPLDTNWSLSRPPRPFEIEEYEIA